MVAIWERRSRNRTRLLVRTFVSWLLIYCIARAQGILFSKSRKIRLGNKYRIHDSLSKFLLYKSLKV